MELEKKLISEGCLPENLKLVILTHGDMDHVGNVKILQDKYKAKIAMNKEDYYFMIPERKVKPILFKIIFKIFVFFRKFKKNKENKDLFKADIFLKDNDSLKKYGFDAKVIYTPGHSKGSICILTNEKNLFSGDIFENRKNPKTAQIIENEDDLKKSLTKIKKLGVKKVYPGHGEPFLISELYHNK